MGKTTVYGQSGALKKTMITAQTLPIIDCRPFETFCLGHIVGASSIPAAEMPGRMHELPKASEPVALCGDAASLQQASEFLVSKGYQVLEQTEWTPALEASLLAQGKLEAGTNSRRLWQPAPLIARFVTEFMPSPRDSRRARVWILAVGQGAIWFTSPCTAGK